MTEWVQDAAFRSRAQDKDSQDSVLSYHLIEETQWYEDLDIFSLGLRYQKQGKNDLNGFFDFCKTKMTRDLCLKAEINSRSQAESQLWFKLR